MRVPWGRTDRSGGDQAERTEARHLTKVAIRREHVEPVTNAKLRKEDIDRPDLEALSATGVSQLCGLDVILAFGNDERERRESLDDLVPCLRTPETLKKLLKDETRGEDGFACPKSLPEEVNLG